MKWLSEPMALHAKSSLLVLCLALGACANGDWPRLSSVERPEGALEPVDLPPLPTPGQATAGSALPPPPPGRAGGDIPTQGALPSLKAAFASKEQEAAAAYAAYAQTLDALLAVPAEGELLVSRWTSAQSALSRLSMVVDELRVVRDDAASHAISLSNVPVGEAQDMSEAGRLVEESAALHARYRAILTLEGTRLSVLTPSTFGPPATAGIGDPERTAFATIRFERSNPAFATTLRTAVNELRAKVPDIAFDVVAAGPGGTAPAQQAALRRVLKELRSAGTAPEGLQVALDETEGAPVTVRIYLRKTAI